MTRISQDEVLQVTINNCIQPVAPVVHVAQGIEDANTPERMQVTGYARENAESVDGFLTPAMQGTIRAMLKSFTVCVHSYGQPQMSDEYDSLPCKIVNIAFMNGYRNMITFLCSYNESDRCPLSITGERMDTMRTITINTENLQISSVRNFIGRIDRFNFRMVKDGVNIDGIISAWIVSKLKTTNDTCVANLKEMRATLDAINVALENHDSGIKVLTDKALKAKNESKSKLETKIVAENAKVENMMLFINDNPKLLELATEYSKNAPACDGTYFEYLYRYFDGKYFTAERHKAMADLVSAVCKEKRTSCYVLEKKIQDTINGRALIDLVKRDFNRFSHMKNDMSIFKPYTANMKTWEYYFVADYIASNVLKETKDGVVLVSESYRSVASKMYRFQILKLQGNKITAMNIDDLK